MGRRVYRILCGILGALLVLAGLSLYLQFFRFHAPGGLGLEFFTLGPGGHYFVAFTGSALVAWGGCLLGAVRRPEVARSVGTATALGLVLAAFYRIVAWFVRDYASLGGLPRAEAVMFLLLALAFVWLRPPVEAEGAG